MWEDLYNNDPKQIGWYAIHYSWDSQEGSFVDSGYFNGSEWSPDYPIFQYAGPFESEEDADEFAEKHDISW